MSSALDDPPPPKPRASGEVSRAQAAAVLAAAVPARPMGFVRPPGAFTACKADAWPRSQFHDRLSWGTRTHHPRIKESCPGARD